MTFRPVWFKKRKFGQPWLRSSAPTAAATSTALWAALIVHARSALASVRTPLRSYPLRSVKPTSYSPEAHARTTAVAFMRAIGYSRMWK